MMAALEAKIDASSSAADQKQMLRGLVRTVQDEPQMADVIAHVVDGDAAGAAEALAAAPEEVRATAAAKFAEGASLEKQGKWDEALVAYRAAVAKDPEMSAAWFAIGLAESEKNGESTEAEIEAYEHCIKLDPKHVGAHLNLGWALHDLREDFDRAEAMYRKAIELDPEHVAAYNNLGLLLNDFREDFDQAEAMYRKAIELDPKDVTAHMNLGNLLKDVREDFDQAEAMYRKAIELDPKDADAYINLANLLNAVRADFDQAEAMYRKAIELDPKDASVHWNFSLLLETRGDVEGAIRETRECVRLGDPEGDARLKELLANKPHERETRSGRRSSRERPPRAASSSPLAIFGVLKP